MTTTIDIRDLPTRFREVLDLAAAGKEVILTDGATLRARLLPIERTKPRVPGLHAGAMGITPDFDLPLPDEFWAEKP